MYYHIYDTFNYSNYYLQLPTTTTYNYLQIPTNTYNYLQLPTTTYNYLQLPTTTHILGLD